MELFTGLVAGMIIGWSLNWAIQPLLARLGDRRGGDRELNDALADMEVRLRTLEAAEAGSAPRLLTVSEEARVAKVFITDRDALDEIHGIGPVFATRLNEAGIYTFDELANLSPSEVREIIDAEEWQELEPEAWIREAGRLAKLPGAETNGQA
jgi:predicted flap endonuclease-1-like 5' DNA nuclease